MGGVKWPILNKIQEVTSWGQIKIDNNNIGLYDNYIYNYINKLDPVGNLFISPDNFKHLGNIKSYDVSRVNVGTLAKFYLESKKFSLVAFTNVYYHLPHVYINLM